MPVGPFTRIAGNKAAGQITIAAFKGLALVRIYRYIYLNIESISH